MNQVVYIKREYIKDGYWKRNKDESSEFVHTGYKNKMVSMDTLMQQVIEKVEELNNQGYEVIQMMQNLKGVGNYTEVNFRSLIKKEVIERSAPGYGYTYVAGITLLCREVK